MQLLIIVTTLATLPSLLAFPHSPKTNPLVAASYSQLETRSHANKSYCPGHPAHEGHQREIFFAFINDLYVKKDVLGAFNTYIAEDLIEHDPFDAQGRAANAAKLVNIIPYIPSTVLRLSFSNNVGLAHVRVDEPNKEPIALADIYRMNGTCIVEHWDVTQPRPVNATNPIAMF